MATSSRGGDVGGVMLVWAFSSMNAIARRRMAGWASWRSSMVGAVSALTEDRQGCGHKQAGRAGGEQGLSGGPGWAWAVSRASV